MATIPGVLDFSDIPQILAMSNAKNIEIRNAQLPSGEFASTSALKQLLQWTQKAFELSDQNINY